MLHPTRWPRCAALSLVIAAGCASTRTASSPSAAAAAPASAALSSSPPQAPTAELAPVMCEGPGRRRDFDFWLGTWEVRGADGKVVGENRIEAVHGGCAVQESWQAASGVAGTSLSFFDPARKRWRQLWVDRTGGIIELEGGLLGSAMVLEGTSLQPDGSQTKVRGTWTPLPDGTVRQVFEGLLDGAWQVAFDGTYQRRR